MAAKLEWKGEALCLGPFKLATVKKRNGCWTYACGARVPSTPYESVTDCADDAEAETRRLLSEIGMEVE
jgi:hypothetical protein